MKFALGSILKSGGNMSPKAHLSWGVVLEVNLVILCRVMFRIHHVLYS